MQIAALRCRCYLTLILSDSVKQRWLILCDYMSDQRAGTAGQCIGMDSRVEFIFGEALSGSKHLAY